MNAFWSLLGRTFMSVIFLFAAANKVIHWEESESYFSSSMTQWHQYAATMPKVQDFFGFLLPLTPILLLIATIFEGLGGLLLFVGVRLKAGATLLILVLIPATLIMHPFWMATGADAQLQLGMFLKNIAILGGLFLLLAAGGGGKKAKPSKE